MQGRHFLACDLGAESGRAILGRLDGATLALDELHRFSNAPVRLPTGLYWDILRLHHDILEGITAAARGRGVTLDGIAVDTWGVDFGLLGEDGALLGNPQHYRDHRTDGIFEKTFPVVSRADIFRQTGIQLMPINTLFQLHAMRLANSPALRHAQTLLFTPDLLNYFLTGEQAAERTIASTSQCLQAATGTWAEGLLQQLEIPTGLFPGLVSPGTRLGSLLPEVAAYTGAGQAPVYATASHDTASAVAAVPAQGERWGYISSGTWSLMGVERATPLLSADALTLNITNEAGAAGTVRLLKNIAGLWPLQECRRAWAAQGSEYSYEELQRLTSAARPFSALLDPNAFPHTGEMPARIARFCERTGQVPIHDPGEVCRALLEGLAFRYRRTLHGLEQLLQHRLDVIHIVGGGSRNHLLNQFAANAMQRPVLAGPVEATAMGNILVQAMGAGELSGLADIRAVVRQSTTVEEYRPAEQERWDDAYGRWCAQAEQPA